VIYHGLFCVSTYERVAIESLPPGRPRKMAEEEWTKKYPIETSNLIEQQRDDRLTLICRRFLWPKILKNRREP